ncbi:hypothetical protein AUP74_01133 [Microbulbifer aggregans]|uniref:Uncharacterized protein n=1 Tax=Microbulbifer aggregans TaxID=1769779 RepID=A0A1C9W618_9GAMM|nr:hypothetical protein [Microbulbifer aggregans]AOS96596.1 hypothetical protein AUP74_01133 [Microbulbifer aggregans]
MEQWINHLIIKPLLIISIVVPIAYVEVSENGLTVESIFLIAIVLGTWVSISLLEKYIKHHVRYYVPMKRLEVDVVLRKAATYLGVRYSCSEPKNNSFSGVLTSQGFTEKWVITSENGKVQVSVSGDYPFPISLYNWWRIHRDVAEELWSQGMRRA